MVIWITGLSSTGKTTLCQTLWEILKPKIPELMNLDGDVIRVAFGNDIGYEEDQRKIQIGRLQNLAKIFSGQGFVVLVAALYSHPELLAWNRKNIPSYYEIYLKTPLETLKKRNTKNLYSGTVPNVVGMDIPWNEPVSPDLTINTGELPPKIIAQKVIEAIPTFRDRGK